MGKEVIFGVTAAAALAAGGIYYVSPAAGGPGDVPPVLVDDAPFSALSRFRSVTVRQFLQHVAPIKGDSGEIERFTRLEFSAGEEHNEAVATLWFDSDRVLVIHATARPVDTRTELDIVAEIPDSRLSRHPDLHPYDRKVLATIADFVVTDYLSSLLNGHRPASSGEAGRALTELVGLDRQQQRAFNIRLERAAEAAYGADIEAGQGGGDDSVDSAGIDPGWDEDFEAEQEAIAAGEDAGEPADPADDGSDWGSAE